MAKAEISVEGFVSKDPESRAAGSHTVTSVTVPVEQGRMKDGAWVADTDQQGNKIVVWWEGEFWNEYGDVVAATVRKGDLVVLRGEARPSAYSKNDGTAGLRASIVNGSVAVLVARPRRDRSGGGSGGGQGGWSQPAQNAPQTGAQGFGGFPDEEPF